MKVRSILFFQAVAVLPFLLSAAVIGPVTLRQGLLYCAGLLAGAAIVKAGQFAIAGYRIGDRL